MTTETNTTNVDRVIDKIAKLLQMKEARGATEAEAANAANMVTKLLQEHNLTLSQVEAHGGATDTGKREKRATSRRAMYKFQKKLMETLAISNFCLWRVGKVFDEQTGRNSQQHQLIGRKINVDATVMTYDYLEDTMRHLAVEWGADRGLAFGRHGEQEIHHYLEGAAVRVCERLEERYQEAKREAEDAKRAMQGNGSGTELVLADVYGSEDDLNNDVLNGYPPGTTAERRHANERRQAEHQAKWERLQADGVEKWEAWYLAHSYGEDAAKIASAEFHKSINRRSRSRSTGRGFRGGAWTKADEGHSRKVNSTAYQAGRKAGNDIGLDTQMTANPASKRIGGK